MLCCDHKTWSISLCATLVAAGAAPKAIAPKSANTFRVANYYICGTKPNYQNRTYPPVSPPTTPPTDIDCNRAEKRCSLRVACKLNFSLSVNKTLDKMAQTTTGF